MGSVMLLLLCLAEGEASLVADDVQGRLAVMEARQSKMESVAQGENEHLKNQVSALQTDNEHLKNQMSTLQTDNEHLKTQVESLQTDNAHLKSQMATFQDHVDAAEKVGFHATGIQNNKPNNGDNLIFPTVTTNIGGGYNHSTGVFTATLPGLYFFAASATPGGPDAAANMNLVVNDNDVVHCFTYQVGGQWQTGTCHAVVSLQAGHTVGVLALGSGMWYWSDVECFFSGFLIALE